MVKDAGTQIRSSIMKMSMVMALLMRVAVVAVAARNMARRGIARRIVVVGIIFPQKLKAQMSRLFLLMAEMGTRLMCETIV